MRYFREFGQLMPAAQYSHLVQPQGQGQVAEAKEDDESATDPNWEEGDEEEGDEEDEPPRRGRGKKNKGKETVQPKGKAKPRQKRKPLQGNSFHLC